MSNNNKEINKLKNKIDELEEKLIVLEIIFTFILFRNVKRSKSIISSLESQLDIIFKTFDIDSGRADRIPNYISNLKKKLSE